MKKAFFIARYTLGILAVLLAILIIADGVYGFSTGSHAPLYVNHQKSYIKSVSRENASLQCAAVLCIKNLRYEQIECHGITLLLRGKNGDREQFERVIAQPINPDPDYICFPGLRSRMIECTFTVHDFGAPLSIEDIELSSLSYQ